MMDPIKDKPNPDGGALEDSTKSLLHNRCHRCGGLMILERCFDVESTTGEFEILVKKCLSCGESIDPTILRNRYRPKTDSVNRRVKPASRTCDPALSLPGWN